MMKKIQSLIKFSKKQPESLKKLDGKIYNIIKIRYKYKTWT